MKRWLATLLACAALALAAPAVAQERILSYDNTLVMNADGSLEVTEQIRIRAEGSQVRRGIYRDFPTRYRNRQGNRVVVDLEVIDVLRDGQPEPWFMERISNGVRINTGNDDFLPVPSEFTYTLRYRTTRQLGFFGDHDELYWNAIGTGWAFAIEGGTTEVRLPQPVPVTDMAAEAYTGVQGAQGDGYVAGLPSPGIARYTLTRPLQPGEGFTTVLSFPKGVAAEPSSAQKAWWLLRDNRAGLVALAGLFVLLAYCITRWRQVGRDPRKGTVVVQYDPPDDLSPAALRYIRRMGYDTICFSADVLSLAVGGYLRIEREKGLLKETWRLQKTESGGRRTHGPEQDALLSTLYVGRSWIALDSGDASTLRKAIAAHTKALEKRFRGRMFNINGGSMAVACLIAFGFSALALVIAAKTGSGLLLALPLAVAMGLVAGTFLFLIPAPTVEGRRLLDRIEGLRRYLGVAEKQDLQRLGGPGSAEPQLDAQRFEFLLPYAVALGVEDAWTKKFTLAVGAAAATAATSAIAWYSGSGRDLGNIGNFAKSVSSGLSSQIASSSSPPGSSSGGGGGGFSGGGGGGGGGGGR